MLSGAPMPWCLTSLELLIGTCTSCSSAWAHGVAGMQGSQNQNDVSASVIPVRLRGGVVALESSFRGGIKLELLRSLCQVANDTQLPLEVALVDAQRRPSARSLSSQTSGLRRTDSLVCSGIMICCMCTGSLPRHTEHQMVCLPSLHTYH